MEAPYHEHVVQHGEDVLNRLVLGDVAHQTQECARALRGVVLQDGAALLRTAVVKLGDEVKVLL